jgi:hypothetical protein
MAYSLENVASTGQHQIGKESFKEPVILAVGARPADKQLAQQAAEEPGTRIGASL